jgi:hypothetical protein
MVAVTAINQESQMTAIVQAFFRVTVTEIEAESFDSVLLFSFIGLAVSLLAAATYGLDLSAGFF